MILSRCQLRSFHQHTLDMFVALFGKRGTHHLVGGALFITAQPCKSLSREKKILLTRASEERALLSLSEPAASHVCLSAVVPAFAEPDIHSLSQVHADRHRRLSVCSLPVPKQFEESLGSLISVAQSATAGPGSLRAV